jgi:glycosyltransferase involved in cell wall biosynthesis
VSGSRPLLSVVVLGGDSAEALRPLLESLCRQTLAREAFELVLVDDQGAASGLAGLCDAFAGRLPLVRSPQRPAGRDSARRHGFYRARGRVILQLQPDDEAPPGLLQAHHDFHLARSERLAGLVGPLLPTPALRSDRAALARWRADPLQASAVEPHRAGPVDLRTCWGARWSFKRALVVELHGSHQGHLTGGHDLELAVRLRDEGLGLEFNEAATCWSGADPGLDVARRRMFDLGVAGARLAASRRRWRLRPWLGMPPGWHLLAPLARLGSGPRSALLGSLLDGLAQGHRARSR